MKNHWPKLILVLLGMAVLVLLFAGLIDWHAVRTWMQHLDVRLLLVLLSLLPLLGFSISVVYLVTGAVFGGPMGVAVVAGISAVHLLGSHWIGRGYLRGPLRRWLKRRNQSLPALPPGEEVSVALMTALVPGLPYFVRNYLLAVSDLPLRTYFWVCWPVYVVRSCLVLFLGDFSEDLNAKRVLTLAAVLMLKVGICAYLLWRVRARLKRGQDRSQRTALQKRLARAAYSDR